MFQVSYKTKKVVQLLLVGILTLCLCAFFPNTAWAADSTWQREPLDGTAVDFDAVTSFASDGTTLYAGTEGSGVFARSSDGTWVDISDDNGLKSLDVRALAFDGTKLYAGTFSGVFEYDAVEKKWKADNAGAPHIGDDIFSLISVGSTLYAGVNNWGVWTYDGESWKKLSTTGLGGSVAWALAHHNNVLYAGTADGVFKYIDESAGWEKTNTGSNGPLTVQSLFSVGSTLYAGTDGDFFGAYVYDGTTWTPNEIGIDGARVYTFTHDGSTLYAGTTTEDKGVLYFDSTSSTWRQINAGLNGTNLNIHALTYHDGKLYAGTNTDGVFSLQIAQVDPDPVPDPAPDPSGDTGSNTKPGLAKTGDSQTTILASVLACALSAVVLATALRTRVRP